MLSEGCGTSISAIAATRSRRRSRTSSTRYPIIPASAALRPAPRSSSPMNSLSGSSRATWCGPSSPRADPTSSSWRCASLGNTGRSRDRPDRTKFLALKKGYHGTHFGGASVNGNANFRRNYEPLLPGVFHIPAPWTYRNPFNETDPARLAQLCAAAMEDEIAFQGADTIAAFDHGAGAGAGPVIVPPDVFMKLAREICDRHGILMISDEVVTGFGRTGAWSGSRLWGVKPDMMTIAKAITSGYFPLGATLIGEKIAEAFEGEHRPRLARSGMVTPIQDTRSGAPRALRRWPRPDVSGSTRTPPRAARTSLTPLARLKARHPSVGDVRSKGLMAAIELVVDRDSKKPADKETMAKVADGTYEAGVMVRVSATRSSCRRPSSLHRGMRRNGRGDQRRSLAAS